MRVEPLGPRRKTPSPVRTMRETKPRDERSTSGSMEHGLEIPEMALTISKRSLTMSSRGPHNSLRQPTQTSTSLRN